MKKLMLVSVLVLVTAGGVFGQTWYDRYAPGIEGITLRLNSYNKAEMVFVPENWRI